MATVLVLSRHKLQRSHIKNLEAYFKEDVKIIYYGELLSVEKALEIIAATQPDAVVPYIPLSIVYRIYLAIMSGIIKTTILLSVDKRTTPEKAEWSIRRKDGSMFYFRHDHFIVLSNFQIGGINTKTGEWEIFIPT